MVAADRESRGDCPDAEAMTINPIRLLRIYARADKILRLFDAATQSYNQHGGVMSKSLFASKIFWIQVLSAAAELSQVLPIPTGTAALVGQIATILVRLLGTSQPVHVVSPS